MRVILFCLMMMTLPLQAAITNVFHLEDFIAEPQRVRQLLIYPIPPSRTNGAGGVITLDRIVRTTGTNGTVIVSNMFYGSYRTELVGTTTTTTNYFVFPVTNGTLNASDWMTNFIQAGVFAYSKADADARFVNISNQNTVTPGSPATIQSKFWSYAANGHITNGGPSVSSQGPIDVLTNFSAKLFIGNGGSLTNLPAKNEKLKVYDVTDYGAVSGTNVTRCSIASGSKTLTTANGFFTQADVGKVISVYGAGADNGSGGKLNLTSIITNVASATSITLSNSATTTVTGTASAVYGPDCTVAIQTALDAVTPQYGNLFFPAGIYIVNGPILDTGTNSAHHNAQLILPDIPLVNGQVCGTLTLSGPSQPMSRGQQSSLNSDINTLGAVIWCTYPRGPDVNFARMLDTRNFNTPPTVAPGCNSEHYAIWFNNINVTVRDLTFYAAFDNNMALLDLSAAQNETVERCYFAAGYPETASPRMSGTNGFAVLNSSDFTQNVNVFDRNTIMGFYNGMGISASLSGTINWISTCENGLMAWDSGVIGNSFVLLEVYECKNIFGTRGCETAIYGNIAVHNNVDGWWNPIVCINDPNSTSFTGNPHFIVNSSVTNGMTIIGALLLDAESVGNYHNAVYLPSVRHGAYAIQSAGETYLGMKYTLGLGADANSRTMTANTLKYFGIGFPRYQDTNFNLCTVLSCVGFNADNTFLALGGDQGEFGNKGVNTIRILTAPDGNTAPSLQWQFTAGALIPVNGSANSVGRSDLYVPTVYLTNAVYGASNTAPANISTVRSWIDVTVKGQTFKMPLYQ